MLDHHKNDHARHDCRRQRHMRRKVVQNDTVASGQSNYSRHQHPSAPTRAAMSCHGCDPLDTIARVKAPHGTFARTNCKSRMPTDPLSIMFKPASLSKLMMSESLT